VSEHCTCGARLVEDALFCHKCGRPQREIGPAEPEVIAPPPLPTIRGDLPRALPSLQEITFHNGIAVRIALLCAVGAWILINVTSQLVLPAIWIVPWLTASGFLAVYLYHRRTGLLVTVKSGARLGWLTGIFCFLIAMILFLLTIAVATTQGGFTAMFRQQMEAQGAANVDEMIRLLESPGAMGMIVIFGTIMGFLLMVTPPIIGGALCAKVLEKE
jgi:hypothetical protein